MKSCCGIAPIRLLTDTVAASPLAAIRRTVTVLIAATQVGCAGTDVPNSPIVELSEVGAHLLPVGFAPFGADLGNDGRFVTWDRRNGRILTVAPSEAGSRILSTAVPRMTDSLVAVRLADRDRAEVVTTRGIWLHESAVDVPVALTTSDSLPIISASYGYGGWNLLVQLATGYAAVVRDRGQEWRLEPIPVQVGGSLSTAPFILALDEERILVKDKYDANLGLTLDRSGVVQSWAKNREKTSLNDGTSLIRVTGVFRIGQHVLQVMADLRSDDRVLLLRDKNGRPLRARSLAVPFGLLAVSDDGRLALGLRGERARELVLYRISSFLVD